MLHTEIVKALCAPLDGAAPCGDDLAYDPAFTALEAAVQGRAEQQFGDTVIPAVGPEWQLVEEQALALLQRSRDLRVAVILLRAGTRLQGVEGFTVGMQLLADLLETHWLHVHPMLDTEDDNDPTMRLNALAPLTDDAMVLRDLLDARIGDAHGQPVVLVRELAVAHGQLAGRGGDPATSLAQVHGALQVVRTKTPQAIAALTAAGVAVRRVEAVVNDRAGRGEAIDLSRLQSIARVMAQAAAAVDVPAMGQIETEPSSATVGAEVAEPSLPLPVDRGEIGSRQDAVAQLDRVIRYLERTEPGNPAPLLIQRAKRLVGVSFFDIMADLAPQAIDAIEAVTGRRPAAD